MFFCRSKKGEEKNMNGEKKNFVVGIYPRVSTEDQSRFGFSLDYVNGKDIRFIKSIVKKEFLLKV